MADLTLVYAATAAARIQKGVSLMNKKVFVAVTAIVLAAAAAKAGTVFAQGPGAGFGPGFGRHGGWMFHHMAKELNLTADQQAQIKGILQAERTKVQPLMQQLRQNEQAQNATVNGNFDEAQARAFANKQTQIMSDLIVEKQRIKSQIYTVLTPEQRQKAQQLMQEHQQKMQERMQKRSQQQEAPQKQ
jgi:periplasmic protein CpxP/Spy